VTALDTLVVVAEVHQGKEGRKGTELGGEVAAEVIQTSAGSQETVEEVQGADEAVLGSHE